eukprot:TRINITY_DN2645_c2_g1_i2.p1 TRINITY_DN2645_c2_g1~~TRINITY_DN2645_c2_g1_i2.p1  ORF type:complete len:152 (+),score=35.73 TRINITY_DN2645_c2_g1_i2:24-458(+)
MSQVSDSAAVMNASPVDKEALVEVVRPPNSPDLVRAGVSTKLLFFEKLATKYSDTDENAKNRNDLRRAASSIVLISHNEEEELKPADPRKNYIKKSDMQRRDSFRNNRSISEGTKETIHELEEPRGRRRRRKRSISRKRSSGLL